MASQYSYEGYESNQHRLRELSTGQATTLPGSTGQAFELLDGDEAAITDGSVRQVWSIREHRVLRQEFV